MEIDGIKFDSKAEAKRYGVLKLFERAGKITDLRLQVPFELQGSKGKKVAKYIADFVYNENGHMVVEDVKGVLTPTYKLKKRIFEQQYGILITEIKK